MKNTLTLLFVFLVITGICQTSVPKKESGSKFSFTCANLYFQIDSAKGARIWSFKCDDKELLYTGGNDPGSTFWPAPQSVWNWPPPSNLDNKAYSTSITGNKITFKGQTDTKTNLRFYKTMYGNEKDTSIIIEYVMKNEKATAQTWAPWEISRVLGKGLTVFAKGDGEFFYRDQDKNEVLTEEVGGYVWYDQDNNEVCTTDNKFNGDGKGWLAHVVDGNMLFIKKFEDVAVSKAAPGEAEVEVYTSVGDTYCELENQGTYASIASKDSVMWKVIWFARKLPSSVDVSVGSKSLTDYIEDVLARTKEPSGKEDLKMGSAIKIYPNPADSEITVESNLGQYDNVLLAIYSVKGQMMSKHSVDQSRKKISLDGLPGGMYVYELSDGSKVLGRGNITLK
ncbi:MAG: T9SS type A sorting domain-containing protein [Prolixibacteraceae bacterium]|nr:T9SS type A sorting domain-containing protein [Prolixibacteraceae bacterium]